MRLWHKDLLPYLPHAQLISQWRECCCIARNIAVNGSPNHILVNRIMDYPLTHFMAYTQLVIDEMNRRHYRCNLDKFTHWMAIYVDGMPCKDDIFKKWHNVRYVLQNFANLQEKHDCGGVSDNEWSIFLKGFSKVYSGEDNEDN